ncbi:3-oxoacid CoA-transferase subunit B [Effusibacillus lacus]|uniref:Acetate CoA-transferase n=1 Tax=Effusibacillus lacus TaxID=1348429 RepID=A0A292YMZ1_9BACL|nr:3-oxoacid CoA-transferase subunit B [Effusibacillus lacus]TCS71618.1 3-oxoacid CoA-transferase/3-oxoacid CoA-transferase subunit B [Effusibacillus lacus]GAX90123.1 acetate CoA-transferase [Effusibacillus lacus]
MSRTSEQKLRIAKRVIREFRFGDCINLGVGIPTLIPDLLEAEHPFIFQTENGLLGMGPTPPKNEEDWDLLNASKKPVTLQKGSAFFDSVDSFAMIRGGHIDIAVLGALQVSQEGLVANWMIPDQPILGVGGAMDLLAGTKKVIVAMTHVNKEGKAKIVKHLDYPLSGIRPVQLIVTDLAVFEFTDGHLILKELIKGMTVEELRKITDAKFEITGELHEYQHEMGLNIT